MNQLSGSSAFNYFDWHVALRGCLMASPVFELQENLPQLPWSPGPPVLGLSFPLWHPAPQPLDHWQSLFPVSGSWCTAFSLWNACPPFCSSPWLTLWVFFSRPSSNMATFGIPWNAQSPCIPARSHRSPSSMLPAHCPHLSTWHLALEPLMDPPPSSTVPEKAKKSGPCLSTGLQQALKVC